METLFIYGIKSSGLIAMFYLAYLILLRKETFFNSNRWFLLAGLITSVVLPLVVFTKIVWVDPSPTNFDWSKIPVTTVVENEVFVINWYLVFAIVYSIGILVFLIKLAFDFYSLTKVLKGKTIQRQADFKFIDLKENVSPFSYFNFIVYNSSLYSEMELENILEHEKVHSTQNHTVDVLISRLFCVVFWFNPLVWLYKKAIVQNLEFIADNEASKNISDKKAYQMTLLKITTQENCVVLTNHFYQSLIKKRIVMLNKNQSNKRNSWKYLFVLPVLGAFVFFFQVKVVAQEKIENSTKIDNLKVELHITAKSTEKELNSEKDFFKEEFNLEINFSEIKTNKDNEIIAIKVELKNKEGITKVNQISGETPIEPFSIFAEKDENKKIKFGFSAKLNDNAKVYFDIKNKQQSGKIAIEKDTTFWSINNFKMEGKDCLIIINGQKQTKDNIIKIPVEEYIVSENTLEPEAATQKYGKDGENGAVEIITKEKQNALKKEEAYAIAVEAQFSENDIYNHISAIKNNKEINAKKALILFDGNEISYQDLNTIDIKTISSSGSFAASHAVKKYGDKGKNGVIFINTKKYNMEHSPILREMYEKENNKLLKKESELDKGEIENSGNETVSSYKQYLEMYKTLMTARFSLERMKVKKEQAKVELEKAKQSLRSKLFS